MKKFLENIFKDKIKIGDTVKCIDDRNWGDALHKNNFNLIFGKKYKVLNILKCPECGDICFDIGGRFIDNSLFTQCNSNHQIPGKGIHWAGNFRFEKAILSKEEIEEEIKECVKEELYEKAHELTKLI